MSTDTTEKLLTVEEVAQRLNVSVSFVYNLVADGTRLKFYRLGKGQGGLRISERQLADYLRASEEGGQEKPQPPSLPARQQPQNGPLTLE